MRRIFTIGLLIILLWPPRSAAAGALRRFARVAVPVADLRREPRDPLPTLDHDPLEESQLLYGEPVRVLEEKNGWARVAAVEQLEWSHHKRWEGYPGWVKSDTLVTEDYGPNFIVTAKQGEVQSKPSPDTGIEIILSLGTRIVVMNPPASQGWLHVKLLEGGTGWIRLDEVTPLDELPKIQRDPQRLRSALIETARLFLGDPYYWGGRCTYNSESPTPFHPGIDCSGLVGLAYQANGIEIPRDAHEQWMKARAIPREALDPGDLVFLSDPKDPNKITHVMLYRGEDRVIEAPGTGTRVRDISLEERLKEANGRRAHFGTYLP